MEENILQLLDRCELSKDLCKAKDFVISHGSKAMCTPFSTNSFNELIQKDSKNKDKFYGSK